MIDFRVIDMSASNEDIVNRGFIQQVEVVLSDGKKRRVLLAIAFEDNNNTNISCRAFGSPIGLF